MLPVELEHKIIERLFSNSLMGLPLEKPIMKIKRRKIR